ncbi:substrate-binding domain-containing protein [Paenibacillus sp. N3.4]|uniref:substrate-binding domain-containing protein n=1 Tax=Paenibacillus sp. N3.4 TaxID=2603222 RepID=UPI001650ABCC|nr:substrate-binding domain-containing protein [Paenibacillus sp. N3.4]
MTITRPILLVVISIVITGFIVVYGIETLRSSKPKELSITVVLKTNNLRSEFWQTVRTGVKAASKEFDVKTEITGPLTESDTEEQIRMLNQALEKKPDAIILAASDASKLTPLVNKIRVSGVKLILIDSPIQNYTAESLITTDNVESGKKAGTALAESWSGGSFKVMTIGDAKGSTAEKERENGLKAALGNYREIENIGTFYFHGTEDDAYELVKLMLISHPDLQGIVGLNETSTLGAARAMKEVNTAGRVKLVGFDSSIYEIKLLEEGILRATIVQRPFNMGYVSIETALKALNGVKVSPSQFVDSLVITKDNMYTQENQELLFPLVEK